jgi:AcrB/AcrD/AcrF family
VCLLEPNEGVIGGRLGKGHASDRRGCQQKNKGFYFHRGNIRGLADRGRETDETIVIDIVYTLSFTSIIGMIALIGIEIKNSILLVDFTNQLRERGTPLDQAIQEAGEVRFLPILLTSATAIGGLTPVMYKLLPPPVQSTDYDPRFALT